MKGVLWAERLLAVCAGKVLPLVIAGRGQHTAVRVPAVPEGGFFRGGFYPRVDEQSGFSGKAVPRE